MLKVFANASAMANPIIYAFTRDDLRKVANKMFRSGIYKIYGTHQLPRFLTTPKISPKSAKVRLLVRFILPFSLEKKIRFIGI